MTNKLIEKYPISKESIKEYDEEFDKKINLMIPKDFRFAEIFAEVDEMIELVKSQEAKFEELSKVVPVDSKHMRACESVMLKTKEIELKAEQILYKMLKDSDGQVDRWGFPTALRYEPLIMDTIKSFELQAEDSNEVKDALLEYINSEEGRKANIGKVTDEEMDAYVNHLKDFMVDYLPSYFDNIGKVFGLKFKRAIFRMNKMIPKVRLKLDINTKKGNKYPSTSDYDLMEELQLYWDENLPNDPITNQPYFRRTYFEYLTKYGKSFKGIEAFEKRYRPRYFKPKK